MRWDQRFWQVAAFAVVLAVLGACHASSSPSSAGADFNFDGTCVQCHLGLSSGHTHPNYKLRCIDCHGGNDQVAIPDDVQTIAAGGSATDAGKFRDPALLAQAHVKPKPGLARYFFANGIDDDGDGIVDETVQVSADGTHLTNFGEVFEPELHGEGPGEFVDDEFQRDLNYTRFLNPGDLRVATVGCGARNRAALDGGAGGGCHQETVDVVRRSIMVNQSAVINGAYYGNESWRTAFDNQRMMSNNPGFNPRAGAFAYALDYDGVDMDACIDLSATHDGSGGRGQPVYNSQCLEQRASTLDPTVAAGAQGNIVGNAPGMSLPAWEMAQNAIAPPVNTNSLSGAAVSAPGTTILETGAEKQQDRFPWGGTAIQDQTAERLALAPVPNDVVPGTTIPDPVDVVLRTFRAYYPVNYPGSVVNQNFTFGTSILPDIARFKTNNPFGRGHSSGCSACHAAYNYDGSRNPTPVVTDENGDTTPVVDPTTKHREFNAATQDEVTINGVDQLVGRTVGSAQQALTGLPQQKTYAADHVMTTAVTTDQCGLCHGFVTRINYAYQGMAEEEQRDQLSRRATVSFATPAGTKVNIVDSWVREDVDASGNITVVNPPGAAIAQLAITRDQMLAAEGVKQCGSAGPCFVPSCQVTAAARRPRSAKTATTTASSRPASR
jgi:hypothetical protein